MKTLFGIAVVGATELERLKAVDRQFVKLIQERNNQLATLTKEKEMHELLVLEVKERNIRLKRKMKYIKDWTQKWMLDAGTRFAILKEVNERVDEF